MNDHHINLFLHPLNIVHGFAMILLVLAYLGAIATIWMKSLANCHVEWAARTAPAALWFSIATQATAWLILLCGPGVV